MDVHDEIAPVAAATGLARWLSEMDGILMQVSSELDLPRRAIQALVLMPLHREQDTASNQWLQEQFVTKKLSTKVSANKDVSAAKSDLLARRLIEIRGKVSVFAITEEGRTIVAKIAVIINKAIDEIEASNQERLLLRELIGLTSKKPVAALAHGASDRLRVISKAANSKE